VCPINGSFFRRPASLHRVWAESHSPASPILSGRYDFRSPVSPHFVSFAWRYPTGRLVVRFHRPETSKPVNREDFGCGTPMTAHSVGDDRISQVPGEPLLSVCPVLRLRQDGGSQTHARAPHGPRYFDDEGSHGATFEARCQGLPTRCLRFAGRVTSSQRKTRFRVRVRLSWAGLITRRVPMKGFRCMIYMPPPFPSLAWRDKAVDSFRNGIIREK